VNVHLMDGDMGPEIAGHLEMGIPIRFMDAYSETLPDGMVGALGRVPKPIAEHVLKSAIRWAGAGTRTRLGSGS
jgi:hypothetical protein